MITVKHISKTYKIPLRKGGLHEAVKAFFHRQYRLVPALNDISFHVEKGEIVGYIGPNGAGKSTTIKIMSGILYPDQGEVLIDGINPFSQRKDHNQNIGVVFGQRTQLWWDIPVIDSFSLLKDIYKIHEKDYQNRLEDYIASFQLEDIIFTPARQLSLGQRMKCELVAALLHAPKLLFLDEPTIGLDAIAKVQMRQLIKMVHDKYHTTIILTTHDMQDIVSLASRIMLIGEGKILFDGDLETLKTLHPLQDTLLISYEGELSDLSAYEVVSQESHKVCLIINQPLEKIITEISQQVRILSLETNSLPLDELMVHIYKGLNL